MSTCEESAPARMGSTAVDALCAERGMGWTWVSDMRHWITNAAPEELGGGELIRCVEDFSPTTDWNHAFELVRAQPERLRNAIVLALDDVHSVNEEWLLFHATPLDLVRAVARVGGWEDSLQEALK